MVGMVLRAMVMLLLLSAAVTAGREFSAGNIPVIGVPDAVASGDPVPAFAGSTETIPDPMPDHGAPYYSAGPAPQAADTYYMDEEER